MSLAGPDSWTTGGVLDFPSVEYPEPEPEPMTLLELVNAVVDSASSDEEAAATILHLLESGQVRLVGQFREADMLRGLH